jgi:hypothetical protein
MLFFLKKNSKKTRCGGFNQKIVLASVSAIWSKKLPFRPLYFFVFFKTKTKRQRNDWKGYSPKNHFWSFKNNKKTKTKATVLDPFCSFYIFQKQNFFRVFEKKIFFGSLT